MKTCITCGKEYEATSEFFFIRTYKDGTKRMQNKCKECFRSSARAKYALDSDAQKRNASRWSQRNPERVRCSQILRTYNVTCDYIMAMMDNQRGCCLICDTSLVTPDSDKSYNIDHDHKTLEVRGLLCHGCNIALGHFKDNPSATAKAFNYLLKYKDSNEEIC